MTQYNPDDEHAFLRGVCRRVGIDPDTDTAPDLEALAHDDSKTLREKMEAIGGHAAEQLATRRKATETR